MAVTGDEVLTLKQLRTWRESIGYTTNLRDSVAFEHAVAGNELSGYVSVYGRTATLKITGNCFFQSDTNSPITFGYINKNYAPTSLKSVPTLISPYSYLVEIVIYPTGEIAIYLRSADFVSGTLNFNTSYTVDFNLAGPDGNASGEEFITLKQLKTLAKTMGLASDPDEDDATGDKLVTLGQLKMFEDSRL